MQIPKAAWSLLLICLTSIECQYPSDDEVTAPIQGYSHPIYSGYLDINVSINFKSIHYVYFQSQQNRNTDPVILWLAGGPGCSGLTAMLQEHGPFVIAPEMKTYAINKYAWNKRAGLVYFEAPAGVGYSLSNNDQIISDQIATQQLYRAVQLFIQRHISLLRNEFYIAGSGYGAAFAARLARLILDYNKEDVYYRLKINIKGILLGNPCVYPDECYSFGSIQNSLYHYQFLYNRGFIPKGMYNQLVEWCEGDFTSFQCFFRRFQIDSFHSSANISAYNIYSKCYSAQNKSQPVILKCQYQSSIVNFLNQQSFKSNWHIRGDNQWQPCSKKVFQSYHSSAGTFHLLYNLYKQKIRTWVYSGDMDSTVPITGTKEWLNRYRTAYQLPILKNWREWWVPGRHKGEDQIGGFIWQVDGITAVSVKGAGFKASFDQPAAMEQVLNGFLDGKTLPYKS